MNFVEERTPKGYYIKIFFDKWQYLVFDKRGRSVYADREKKSLLHSVPVIILVGSTIALNRDPFKDYTMLKIRDGVIVVPYQDLKDGKTKYFFLPTGMELDSVPARLKAVKDVAQMVREIDMSIHPDFVVVDDNVTPNDVIIIQNRYKAGDIIYIELANNHFLSERFNIPDADWAVNVNMMSSNPVFLALMHLRSMELSKINQLLLDFEITALDTEYILSFIMEAIENRKHDPLIEKNKSMLDDLLKSFRFYHSLLQKDGPLIKEMIDSISDSKKLTPYRTLVSKMKSMFPGPEEQKLYTEYENMLYDKLEDLKVASR